MKVCSNHLSILKGRVDADLFSQTADSMLRELETCKSPTLTARSSFLVVSTQPQQ
jgi:hypothetical protein